MGMKTQDELAPDARRVVWCIVGMIVAMVAILLWRFSTGHIFE